MSNILIVESENDKSFVEALIKHWQYEMTVSEPICRIFDIREVQRIEGFHGFFLGGCGSISYFIFTFFKEMKSPMSRAKANLKRFLKLSKAKIYADCLSSWKSCVEEHGKKITDKYFDKFWVNYLSTV
ncbi:MAG TPA: hypothetical protein ENG03_04170 [Thioploca sp.]|nr:MAG: hypothetical protein DRR19_09670 [Gammaproteobacteria bacterium]HDN26285.1 hypothetical protein [Thioploca sp.]